MYPRFTLWIILLFAQVAFANAANSIDVGQCEGGIRVTDRGHEGFTLHLCIPSITFLEEETEIGNFTRVRATDLTESFAVGTPNLPLLSKLIEVPFGAEVTISAIEYNEQIIDLNSLGYSNPIVPAQPSHSKSEDPSLLPFHIDSASYLSNSYNPSKICSFEDAGVMRTTKLGRIEVRPIQYNPTLNSLRILNELVVEVNFVYEPKQKSVQQKAHLASPYFKGVPGVINSLPQAKSLITDVPVTYVIVSDPMFADALQPFVEWKQLKGFHVIEAYTNNPEVGNTTGSIKSYLEGLYNNPPEGVNSPTFGLLVGDVQQIPAFAGQSNHVTDLYYFEYTGDKIPEVFYGRFSAQNVDQLTPQIEKTLEYEQYLMEDTDYLSNHILVAGVDKTYATVHGNGHIRYAHTYYSNQENGVNPITYLYDDTAGSTSGVSSNSTGASAHIRGNVNNGAGWVNYTAHCSASGWLNPSFSSAHIPNLSNYGKYGVWIGNCCESNRFSNNECFGEAALRANGKGAVGYIGASNLTYWHEDYYFAVGVGSPAAHPNYNDYGAGLYDALFHTQPNEATDPSTWFITQGQLNMAGNLAVEASSSSRKNYYWEIYHLMGEPSLVPYLRVPTPMEVTLSPNEIIIGSDEISVSCAPYAQVALSQNGELLAVALANSSGNATLNLNAKSYTVGDAYLVITAQNYVPHLDTVNITVAEQPFISLIDHSLSGSPSYGAEVDISIKLENIVESPYNASNVSAKLHTISPYASILKDSVYIGTIMGEEKVELENAFKISIANNTPDQTSINLKLDITGEYNGDKYLWKRQITIKAKAPVLNFGEISFAPDNKEEATNPEPGDTGQITIPISNTGHAQANNISISLTSLTENLMSVTDVAAINIASLAPGASTEVSFAASVSQTAPMESVATLKATAATSSHQSEREYTLTIGYIPSILMGQNDTEVITQAHFFDSGGPDSNYSNNENDTVSFLPQYAHEILLVSFSSFDIESDYDYLYIFDGPNTSYPQLPGSPYTGREIPNHYLATNEYGALTFVFASDQTITGSGWQAFIQAQDLSIPPECTQLVNPLEEEESLPYPTPLEWELIGNAIGYDVFIGKDSLPNTPTAIVNSTSFSYELNNSSTYLWKVVPLNNAGSAQGCPVWSITTGQQHLTMQNGDFSLCSMIFYDSGGSNASYSNNEDDTLTIRPEIPNRLMWVSFEEFNLERDYDFLHIYNGSSVNDPKIGSFHGTTPPEPIRASNPNGALTFHFTSDGSVVKPGWKAQLLCIPDSVNVTITVTDAFGNPTNNALVEFGNLSATTGIDGKVYFRYISMEQVNVSVSAAGYPIYESEINSGRDSQSITIPLYREYSLTLNALPAEGGTVEGGGIQQELHEVHLIANPNQGYIFKGWISADSIIDSNPEFLFTMPSANVELTALFNSVHTLTLTSKPDGKGYLTGGGVHEADSLVEIQAVPAHGYRFVGWYTTQGTPVVLVDDYFCMPDSSVTLEAHFDPNESYIISTKVTPENAGVILGEGVYMVGEQVTLTAQADNGFRFTAWYESNRMLKTDNPFTFSMPNRSMEIQADFEVYSSATTHQQNQINVYPNPFNRAITVTGSSIIQITLQTIMGQKLKAMRLEGTNSIDINTTSLPNGIYLISIETIGGEIAIRRIVKQ